VAGPDDAVQARRSVSVVVPVYRGATTLPDLVCELAALRTPQTTPGGRVFQVDEVLLVWDHGDDGSDAVIRKLCAEHAWLRAIWLSRNFGQHAATLAGMTSAGGDWIVTMDEDGQHNPTDIAAMLDTAYDARAQLVYASPTNPPPHGVLRNAASRLTKWLFAHVLATGIHVGFTSYRLILGEAGRSVAAYVGPDVYLDVALSWVVADVAVCPVTFRAEGRPATSYTYRQLTAHFLRLVVSSGTRPLRLVSVSGLLAAIAGVILAVYSVVRDLTGDVKVQGWTSVFVVLLVIGGAILFSLGIIAEYIAAAQNMSMGKPVYMVVRDPAEVFDDVTDA
jgi:glycosyltransferase involved in cell wall biosynthesis